MRADMIWNLDPEEKEKLRNWWKHTKHERKLLRQSIEALRLDLEVKEDKLDVGNLSVAYKSGYNRALTTVMELLKD